MRKTALILAGAAVFDLGVVAVSVQAQESLRPVAGNFVTAPGTTSNRDHIDQDAELTACANGALPLTQLIPTRSSSGWATAYRSANASSMPVSTSSQTLR